jgi:anti-sigma factor RsiW
MGAEQPPQGHLESGEVAAYLDGALPRSGRSRIEAHVAVCEECRRELIEVGRLLRTRPHRHRWYLPVGVAAAAAAVVLLAVWPRPAGRPAEPGYREPAVTSTVAPVVVAPRGVTAAVPRLVWTAVPHADRYRLAVFDDTGRVVWETETGDTSVPRPDSIPLQQGARYFWKVEARTGWQRWVGSELVGFSLGPPRP